MKVFVCAVALLAAEARLEAAPCQMGTGAAYLCSFEEGLAGWSQASNVVIDVGVAYTGERSVCLAVKDPKIENVYVTRSVPVEGGGRYRAACFVRGVTRPLARG